MANGHGGRRPGSGRKPDPARQEFRAWLRSEFNREPWKRHIRARAKKSDRVLVALLAQAFGAPPQALTVTPDSGLKVYTASIGDAPGNGGEA